MADGNASQQTSPSNPNFDQSTLNEILQSVITGAASFQEAADKAAAGDYQSAINAVSHEFTNQSNTFSQLAANAQARGDAVTAARFQDWARRTAAQAESFASTGTGTAESIYDSWIDSVGSRAQAVQGAFSSGAVQEFAKGLGVVGLGDSLLHAWNEKGLNGVAEMATASLGGELTAEALALLLAAFLPVEAPALLVGIIVGAIGFFVSQGLYSLFSKIEDEAKGIKDDTYRIVRYDPLALDLNGDGVVGTAKEGDYAGAMFDNNGDGIKTASGWVGPDDGLLVRDLNGNGTIDNGSELFGEQTVVGDDKKAADGFAALASLDSNSDGVVDASDAGFASLRVWRDANGNGVTDIGELLSLGDLGITSVSVTGAVANTAVDGGTLAQTGTFTKTNADGTTSTGVMDDFKFDNDSIHSEYTDHIAVPDDIAALPDVQGLGSLRDLHEAAALSPALAQALSAFAAATTRADQQALLDNLLLEWAKTSPKYHEGLISTHLYGTIEDPNSDNVASLTPGQTVSFAATPLDSEATRKIRVAQMVLNEEASDTIGWSDTNVPQYNKIYDTFAQGVYASLAAQTRLGVYINSVALRWSDSSSSISFDFSATITQLQSKFAADELVGVSDLIDLIRGVPLFADNKAAFSTLLSDELDKIDSDGLDGALRELYDESATIAAGVLSFTSSPTSSDGDSTVLAIGDAAVNTVSGGDADDFLIGGAGDDVLNGNGGDDTLIGGQGNDQLNGGAGADLLDGSVGDDVLNGSDGYDTLLGGAGNDVLTTGNYAKDNVLEGGSGDDSLIGSYWADTYLFNLGDGHDTITEIDTAETSSDTVTFGAGIDPADVTVLHDGNDMVLALSNGTDQLRIKDWFANTWNADKFVEQIAFADGTVWTPATIAVSGAVVQGTDADETVQGWNGTDVMHGGGGNDTLTGNGGNDVLDGGAGDDYLDGSNTGANHLIGGAGNDVLTTGNYAKDNVLEGGSGDDSLIGSYWADTYLFNLGDGHDTITEIDTAGTSSDTVTFGAGITDDQLWFTRDGNDLDVQVIGTTDIMVVKGWYLGSGHHVETFKTKDGHVLHDSQVDALVSAMASFAPPASGQTTLPEPYREQLTPVLAANWS